MFIFQGFVRVNGFGFLEAVRDGEKGKKAGSPAAFATAGPHAGENSPQQFLVLPSCPYNQG
jgi:hypothetical protein